MQTQTYEIEEMSNSEASILAADGEAMLLVEKLGLTGQKKLINPNTGTRLPYPQLTALENLVFRLYCPETTVVEEYKSGIIPVRVLQVVLHCRDNGWFPRIEVWHPEDVKTDPVLLGRTKDNSWEGELYLLARWGNELKEFAQLVLEAKDKWITNYRTDLAKAKTRIASDLENLDDIANKAFKSGKAPSAYYNGF
jgi:hypothetical protein